MPSHLADALSGLTEHCDVCAPSQVNGWIVDAWRLSPSALIALGASYKAVLQPPGIEADVVATLGVQGIDLGALLLDEDNSDDTITRADMIEIAAAVTLVVADGFDVEHLNMPNVPKGQRNLSVPGIDVVGAKMKAGAPLDSLGDDEYVVLCSVKHTTVDAADLRGKLVSSLSADTLTTPYIVHQLRLLDGKLTASGLPGGRVFLTITSGTPFGKHLRLAGIAAVDTTLAEDLHGQLDKLPVVVGSNLIRQFLIPDISKLHEHAK